MNSQNMTSIINASNLSTTEFFIYKLNISEKNNPGSWWFVLYILCLIGIACITAFSYIDAYLKRKSDELFVMRTKDFEIRKEVMYEYGCFGKMTVKYYFLILSDTFDKEFKKIFNLRELYGPNNLNITLDYFLPVLPKMDRRRSILGDQLVDFLYEYHEETLTRYEKLIEDKKITYDALWYLFQDDYDVMTEINGNKIGARITSSQYACNAFNLNYEYFYYEGYYSRCCDSVQIPYFNGTMDISDIKVSVMSDTDKEKFMTRGNFVTNIIGSCPQYLMYDGGVYVSNSQNLNYSINSRVMIDPATYQIHIGKNCPLVETRKKQKVATPGPTDNIIIKKDGDDDFETYDCEDNDGLINKMVTFDAAKDAHILLPYIGGYLVNDKKWVLFNIDNLSEVKFNDVAMDNLVLPDKDINKKDTIITFIKNLNNIKKTDFIATKGGGMIFLLNGPSGVGKSFTAEATAEVLHRPLYYLTSGELGTTPGEVEEKLSIVLKLIGRWNAVLLIDEVDIFLEKRDSNNILRNSIVGIFLKLLEYHNGIIFLTTNKLNSLDNAVYSRIHLVITYEELDEKSREKIWCNLLKLNDISIVEDDLLFINVKELAKYKLNGRQIRNTINLVKCFNYNVAEPITTKTIKQIINLNFPI